MLNPTNHSSVYLDFKEIEVSDYRKLIRFFEDRERVIYRLDFDERFELLLAYVNALFEIGAYQKYLLVVDFVVESSVVHNIKLFRGEDVFQKLLFRKAASFFNTGEYEKADYILRELIRIDPDDEDAVLFLKKCLRKMRPALINSSRAVGIFMFLLAAFVICIEVLFVRPFYDMHTPLVEASRNTIFILGLISMFGGQLLHRWRVEREVMSFVSGCRGNKQVKKESYLRGKNQTQ